MRRVAVMKQNIDGRLLSFVNTAGGGNVTTVHSDTALGLLRDA